MNYRIRTFIYLIFDKTAYPILKSSSYRRLVKIIEKTDKKPKVAFLCSGNICRSPFAEFLFKDILKKQNLNLPLIASAGLHTNQNLLANDDALRIAKNFNIDLSQHRTTIATKEYLSSFDIIFVMESLQLAEIGLKYPESYRKTFLLSILENNNRSTISDPYGKSDDIFQRSFEIIKNCILNLANQLKILQA